MIDGERFKNLEIEALEEIYRWADLDCGKVRCFECPFELDAYYPVTECNGVKCALAYGKALYRRLTE